MKAASPGAGAVSAEGEGEMKGEDFVDSTARVRPGEELDAERLSAYLRKSLPGLSGELTIEQFPSGHSNLTYLVRVGAWELVLRRPPFGSKVKSAHDMGREFRILSAIHPVYPLVPRPLFFCEDERVMGAKFYVMERIKGVILRRTLPEGLDFPPELAEKCSRALVKNLADIHAVDYRAVGLSDLAKPEGFLARQVKGWTDRYYGSQTDDIPGVDELTAWLAAHLPESPPPALIHNDYKYDNVILDPADLSRIRGVLDWEMSTIGDPLMDLGVFLSYWVQEDDPPALRLSAFGPTAHPGSLSRRQLAEYYAELTGRDISFLPYYLTFALFKLAVILQQIYYRFHHGFTRDERFAPLINMVKLLIDAGREQMNRDTV